MVQANNSALSLYGLLKQWSEGNPSGSILSAREETEGKWWEPHVRAVKWLNEVEAHLCDPLEGIDFDEQNFLMRLKMGVLSVDAAMSTSQNDNVFESTDLMHLRRIGLGWPTLLVDPATAREMDQLVGELLDMAESSEIDAESKRYLLELGVSLRKALTEINYFGQAGVRALANQLIGALTVAFDVDNNTDADTKAHSVSLRKRFAGAVSKFGAEFSTATAKSLGTATGIMIALPAPPI